MKLMDYLLLIIFRVKFTMDPFIQRFQPELYEKWMRNLDIAPHPEDPPELIERVLARAKGQEISERNFSVLNFPNKRNKKISIISAQASKKQRNKQK